MHLHFNHNLQLSETHIEAKLGDHLPLTLHYHTHDGTPYLPPISSIILAAKLPEQYQENTFLLYNNIWIPDHQNKTLTGTLKLNTQTLANHLENKPWIDLHAEIEHSAPGWKNTTLQPLHIRIWNDIIKNNETIDPDDTTPDYATKPYVDQTVTNKLQQGLADHIETLETLKTAAQTAATQSTTHASHSQTHATHAANSAATATTQAQTATQQATTATQASTTATQAATLATTAATQAQNSITTIDQYTLTAQAAAGKAQNIADTLGDEVAQAKQAAKEAATSATQAQNATAGIDENVKKVEQATHTVADDLAAVKRNKEAIETATKDIEADRKEIAENTTKTIEAATKAEQGATNSTTKATQAAASANTASTKATQAGTSATAASTSATNAANSATTAQTHATTASASSTAAAASATQAGTARDAAVTAKTAAEAAAGRAEAASGGGITDAQVNTKINAHNTSTLAHSAEMAQKLDNPAGGTAGQVLTKTVSGAAWNDAAGGDVSLGGNNIYTGVNTFQGTTKFEYEIIAGGAIFGDISCTGFKFAPPYGNTPIPGAVLTSIDMSGDVQWQIVNPDLSNALSSSVNIMSGSTISIMNDCYVGLEVSGQGDTTISGETLTFKSGALTKTLEELINAGGSSGGSGGDKPIYIYSKSYTSSPNGKWEELCAKNPPNGIYKVYIEAGGLHAPAGISIYPSEILSSVSSKFTNGAASGMTSEGNEVMVSLFGHRFEHVPNINFSHISYLNTHFIYKKESDGLQFLLRSPGYVPTYEIDIAVIMIPLANDYTPL